MSNHVHWFKCNICEMEFSIQTKNKNYSDALKETDGLITCPNAVCGSSCVSATTTFEV